MKKGRNRRDERLLLMTTRSSVKPSANPVPETRASRAPLSAGYTLLLIEVDANAATVIHPNSAGVPELNQPVLQHSHRPVFSIGGIGSCGAAQQDLDFLQRHSLMDVLAGGRADSMCRRDEPEEDQARHAQDCNNSRYHHLTRPHNLLLQKRTPPMERRRRSVERFGPSGLKQWHSLNWLDGSAGVSFCIIVRAANRQLGGAEGAKCSPAPLPPMCAAADPCRWACFVLTLTHRL
jgi:hypothetical protein